MRLPPYFKARRAKTEIGELGFRRLERILRQHYGGETATHFRAAPSIVCRSELELLGVAAPRFAHRTPLISGDQRGFISCRRLKLLGEQLEKLIPTRWDTSSQQLVELDPGEFETAVRELRRRVEQSSPIAESILPPPQACREYHVIARDYTHLFGEAESIFGTPFVNAIELGGGVCAQGACFMAAMMRIEDATCIHGPSEITAIRDGGDSSVDSLRVRGFRFGEFVSYFRHPRVGLNCFLEFSTASASDSEAVLDRLRHCHISSHSPAGHFGDGPLRTRASITPEMQKLLELYADEIRRNDPLRPIHVSVELEAAADLQLVRDSVRSLYDVCRPALPA